MISTELAYSKLSLEELHRELLKTRKLDIKEKFTSKQAAHDAGYDAWMTGCCFLMMKEIKNFNKFENCVKMYGHPYMGIKFDEFDGDFYIKKNLFFVKQNTKHEKVTQD